MTNVMHRVIVVHDVPDQSLCQIWAKKLTNGIAAAAQDFMGFLHIGWDLATTEDSDETDLMTSSPAWEAASKVPCHLLDVAAQTALASP